MQLLWLLALLALVAFAAVGFWRGLRTKPTRGYRGEFIAGASDEGLVGRHTGQSDGHSGGSP
jgi:hypothetical protein